MQYIVEGWIKIQLKETLMDEQIDPNGFLVVLPGEIIATPRDSDKSWLMLFYSLTQELEKQRKRHR